MRSSAALPTEFVDCRAVVLAVNRAAEFTTQPQLPVFWNCHVSRDSRLPLTRPIRRRDSWAARKPHLLPTGGARLPGGFGGAGEAAGGGARGEHRRAAVSGQPKIRHT